MNYFFCQCCNKITTCKKECREYLDNEYNRVKNGEEYNSILLKVLNEAETKAFAPNEDLGTEQECYRRIRWSIRNEKSYWVDYKLPPFEPYLFKYQIIEKETGEINNLALINMLLDEFDKLTKEDQEKAAEYIHHLFIRQKILKKQIKENY